MSQPSSDSVPWEATNSEDIRQWVINHDDSWLFVVSYVALAVGLSLYSLFWLVVVVALHFLLEWGRQSHRFESRWKVLAESIWEIKLDIGLIFFALALTLYLPLVFGVLGLSSATRAAAGAKAVAKSGSRMARLKNGIRAALMSLDDVALLAKGVIGGKVATDSVRPDEVEDDEVTGEPKVCHRTSWTEPWSMGSYVTMGVLLLSTGLVLAAPFFTGSSPGEVVAVILSEMQPFP